MPSEKTAEMREFESWALRRHGSARWDDRRNVNGDYIWQPLARVWPAWQAACAATAARVRREVVALVKAAREDHKLCAVKQGFLMAMYPGHSGCAICAALAALAPPETSDKPDACGTCGSGDPSVRGTIWIAGDPDKHGDGERHADCPDAFHDAPFCAGEPHESTAEHECG